MTHTCSRCQAPNQIVNQCGCDPSNLPTRPRVFRFTCCCCDEEAPGYRQWWNRDTGYGICQRCFEKSVDRFGMVESIDLYGEPGIHHSVPRPTDPAELDDYFGFARG